MRDRCRSQCLDLLEDGKCCKGPISVLVRGGSELSVNFKKSEQIFRAVTLTGPARIVFEGTIDL